MTTLFGLLGRDDGDTSYIDDIGSELVFDAAKRYVDAISASIQLSLSTFVQPQTIEKSTARYKLPGSGGRLQRRAPGSRGGSRRAHSGWDVGFPLDDFSEMVVADRVEMAYMTLDELDRHISSIKVAYINTLRYELQLKLFKNTNTAWTDPLGLTASATVVPLANSDTVKYPPILGAEADAIDNHYLTSGYAASAISNTNDPYTTVYEELVEHFDDRTGGESVVVFIHSDQEAATRAMRGFTAVADSDVRVGDNVDAPENLPNVPGKIIGKVSECWVSVWRWMPTGYMLGLHLDEEAPLRMRVDRTGTGLPSGLALVSNQVKSPFVASEWSVRFGFGVANRLNGVVMYLATGSTYSIPTKFQ